MTPHLLARQLRDRQYGLGIIPRDVLERMSDESVIRGYCIGDSEEDNESLSQIIASAEHVTDFFDALRSDRNAAQRLWPHGSSAAADIQTDPHLASDKAPNVDMDDSEFDPFKFLPFSDIRDFGSPLVFAITEEFVQEFAEDNCDGPLTEEELRNLYVAFCESYLLPYLDDAISKIRPHLRSATQASD